MSNSDQPDCEINNDQQNEEQFRDLPTSDEHGGYISYFDAVLWIEDHLSAVEGDSWDAAWGYRGSGGTFERGLSQIPQGSWPNLLVDMADGQPAHDRKKHSDRWYGRALTVESEEGTHINFRTVKRDDRDQNRTAAPEGARPDFDPVRPEIAWIGLCFLKNDVLKHWPVKPGRAFDEPEKNAPPLRAKICEVARELWPDGNFPARVKERDTAIANWFIRNQQAAPDPKTIHRALPRLRKP